MEQATVRQEVECKHCGTACRGEVVTSHDLAFCCAGCKAVYELLHQADLDAYYNQSTPPGLKPQDTDSSRFAYLDDHDVQRRLVNFTDGQTGWVTFSIPQIHCSSCIWLLENLFRLHTGVSRSQVNFLRREVAVQFDQSALSLRQLVELLSRLGYEPHIKLDKLDPSRKVRDPRAALRLKVGIAGFCFGNIMLLSFPDYINSRELSQTIFPAVFRYVMLALSLPVLLYSAKDYFRPAYLSLRSRTLTLDLPLALGLAALWSRSFYDILAGHGPGYLDSFTGLVFFLLIGKPFQQRTYEHLSFERDYKSYFPASITRKVGDCEASVPITSLAVGDRIIVRNQELIPADSILIRGDGLIDYSFVTGEAEPRAAVCGEMIYAGGRQAGTAIELEVIKEVSQSYLTSLWNNSAFQKDAQQPLRSLADHAGKYFIAAVLLIAAATAVYWLRRDADTAVKAVTSVLIVACPCALALSSPFVFGTALRIYGRHKFYLKSTAVVECLSAIDSIVFDKTGTLTSAQPQEVTFDGLPLTPREQSWIKSLVRHSTHPVSRRLDAFLPDASLAPVQGFAEEPGSGIAGEVDGVRLQLGRYSWLFPDASSSHNGFRGEGTVCYFAVNGESRGKFITTSSYRNGLEQTIAGIKGHYSLSVLSGDNDRERSRLTELFGDRTPVCFNQSPYDKLTYVESQAKDGRKVLMVGDGLNDAGALKAAAVGIAVSEDAINFTPACDAILEAGQLPMLDKFLALARASRKLVIASFVISVLYNTIGLGFAVSGHLSPLVSAILMPISSVSVIAFATVSTRLVARRIGVR